MAKFVRQFGEIGRLARAAVDEYVKEVKARSYPAVPKETYGMPKEELEEFRRLMGEEKKE
jgi:3-methyl-2-oxobutanoate hydroxymethyltransferase